MIPPIYNFPIPAYSTWTKLPLIQKQITPIDKNEQETQSKMAKHTTQ